MSLDGGEPFRPSPIASKPVPSKSHSVKMGFEQNGSVPDTMSLDLGSSLSRAILTADRSSQGASGILWGAISDRGRLLLKI